MQTNAESGSAATGGSPAAAYGDRLKQALADGERLGRRAGWIGILRFVAFFAALLAAGTAFDGHGPVGLLWALSIGAAIGFIALVIHHGDLYQRLERSRILAEVNRLGLRRLDGTWVERPAPPPPPDPPPYAGDLDLHGTASLTALIDTTRTRYGQAALWQALSHAASTERGDVAAAQARQAAVRELAPLIDLRQRLEVAGRSMFRGASTLLPGAPRQGEPDPEPLLRWAEGGPLLRNIPALRLLALLPLVTLPLLALRLFLPALPPVLGQLALLGLLGQGLLMMGTAGRITTLLNRVSSSEAALSAYGEILTLVCEAPLDAPLNRALQQRLRDDSDGRRLTPEQALDRLRGTYGMLEIRHNPLVWFPLNILFLWDLNFALRLEKWQVAHGPRLRGWLLAVGEAEARASLSHLAFDNPGWAFPEFSDATQALEAEDLGHPLLPADRRVGNDVTIPGPGQALLVTGSNMSGKSTLLRAVGLLQVLAQAGAPVCARRARLPMLTLRTVVRVDDSLARGLSHFYAELGRLKEVVDAARPGAEGPPLLYLLDEILHGTNTRERELGARLTIRTLCGRQAMGVVTTHDLSLATLEAESGGAIRNFHFTEIIEDGKMRFDYRLRPGPVQTSNALRLMRECGIALDWSLLPEGIST